MYSQRRATMGNAKTELMQFKVTPHEREVIEKRAKKEKMTVSEFVRAALLMEMVLLGDIQALKIVATTIGRQAVKALYKRADQISAASEKLGVAEKT